MTQENPKHVAAISAVLFVLALGVPDRGLAGALILEHLATVSKVQVIFPTGGLQYDPPPGIDLDYLEKSVRSVVRGALEKEGLQVADTAPQKLVISLLYQRDKRIPEAQHAFHILVELAEEAVLDRTWSAGSSACRMDNSVWVTSWSESSLTLTPSHLALERILEDVHYGVTKLAHKIVQARAVAAESALRP